MEKQKPTSSKSGLTSSTSAKSTSAPSASGSPAAAGGGRRGFLTAAAAIVIGGIVTVFPFAAGLAVFLDPLSRPVTKVKRIKVATLESLEADGLPHQFPIHADLQDAWNRYPNAPIGSVYLIREPGQDTVVAFNAKCPHAGCTIAFPPDESPACFRCPCHGSTFTLDGKKVSDDGASPRNMDSLNCNVSKTGDIIVDFQNYRIAIPEKEPKA